MIDVQAIISDIRDYFAQNGTDETKAVIGISGGKDSTVAAALLCRALGPDRVIAVLMPNGIQSDIDDAKEVVELLGIKQSHIINIEAICHELYMALGKEGLPATISPAVTTNTPARIRMAILYAIAGTQHGRVINTSNRSEMLVGYSTKFGDSAGDFSLFMNYHANEVIEIGELLFLPSHLIHKAPADGMTGRTDEEVLGFTYADVQAWDSCESLSPALENKIRERVKNSSHKYNIMPKVEYHYE